MDIWNRRRNHVDPRRDETRRRGSINSPRRGRVSLLSVVAIGISMMVVEYIICFAIRSQLPSTLLPGTQLEVERADQQEGNVVGIGQPRPRSVFESKVKQTAEELERAWERRYGVGNDQKGALVVHVEGPRSDTHRSKAAAISTETEHKKEDEHNEEDERRVSDAFHQSVTRLRDDECIAKDCRVLMTGCGRSGTHFVAEQLANAGVPISHEKIGKVGTVSWIHAVPFRPDLAELEVFFSDSQSVKLRESPDFQFSPVFHLVRHPLAAIASLTECFCGCGSMSCGGWADVPSWKWAGKFVEFSERHCSRMKAGNEVCEWHNHPDGRLLRSMEYWVQWNKLVEVDAHFRVQLETMVLSEVVIAASQLSDTLGGVESASKIAQKPFASKRGLGKMKPKSVTWEQMRLADAALEQQVWELAESYGYERNPP